MKLGDMPEASLADIPFERALHYACRDADATCRVKPELHARLQAMRLEDVYRLELDTYHLIDRMMMVGVKPDLDHFAGLSFKLQGEVEEIQYRLEKATGIPTFNANSYEQVGEYLFDTLGLPSSKRTPGGSDSTNDIILEGLEREYGLKYPVISDIREYREVFKLKSTFVDRIPDFVDRWPFDGRVHCTLRTTRVVTGRLAASDPNLLAQPEHGKWAKDFKRGWVAGDGHLLGAWDESQIELRVLAHLSQDPVLLGAYRDGLDLHARLAVRIFGGTETDHREGTGRLAAKAINFGIPMGMQAQGLCLQLKKNGLVGTTEDDAQRWLDETAALYTGVVRYKSERIAEARRSGFVRCLSGRIRYIGGIRSWDDATKAEAERFAFSTPIQEGAQWVMKRAEARVWTDVIRPLQRAGYWIEPLMQVHDALKLEFEEGLAQDVHPMMVWAMTKAVDGMLCVPLAVAGTCGRNMADMEKRT